MYHKRVLFVPSLFLIWLGLACRLTSAQSTSCPSITINDLGSTTEFSSNGLVAMGIVPPGEANAIVPVKIRTFTPVCDASGNRTDTSSFVSVVVQFQCDFQSAITSLAVCSDPNNIVTRQYQFECIERGGQPVWDASVSGSNLNVQTIDPTATLSTPLANQCRRCIDDQQSTIPVDPTTHCDPCPSRCDQGQRRCYLGPSQEVCCNFYLQGNCETNCPSALAADSNFNCVCPALILRNGTVSYSMNSNVDRDVGSVATHTCDPGFRLLPQGGAGNTRTCSTSGWSRPYSGFICEQIVCPNLIITNGTVSISPPSRLLNSRTIYSCNEDHALKGDGNRICQEDSTWSGTAPECAECSPALQDSNCEECGFDSNNLPICATCRVGYRVVDRQCVDVVCPALTLVNGAVSYSMNSNVVRDVGSVATYTCDFGFRLIPQGMGNTRTCNTSGWNGQDFMCELILCPDLTIANGIVTTSPLIRILSSRTIYNCNEGYALKGEGNRICQEDSTWSGTDPECADCSPALQDSNCEECGFDSNNLPICTTCREGYKVVGGQCKKEELMSGVSSHYLNGILLIITLTALCAILK